MPDNNITYSILSEIVTIKWLLILIGISCFILACAFFVIAKTLLKGIKRNEPKDKEANIEYLLDSGKNQEAIKLAKEWLELQPKHAHAHWQLAKAYYANGEFVAAKKTLIFLLKLAPHFEQVVDSLLEKIESELKIQGPKVIKNE